MTDITALQDTLLLPLHLLLNGRTWYREVIVKSLAYCLLVLVAFSGLSIVQGNARVNRFSAGMIPMRTYWLLLIALLCASCAVAQYGEAPNGYYPSAYGGDIFSGKVAVVDEATGQITISFKEKNNAEVFVGRLQEPCAVPSKDGKPMTALDLPIGTDVTVFFEKNVKRDENSSTKENLIIGIMFHSWDGHPVRQTAKKMYLCSHAPISNYLRCFSSTSKGCVEQIDPITHAR